MDVVRGLAVVSSVSSITDEDVFVVLRVVKTMETENVQDWMTRTDSWIPKLTETPKVMAKLLESMCLTETGSSRDSGTETVESSEILKTTGSL